MLFEECYIKHFEHIHRKTDSQKNKLGEYDY